MKNLFNFKWLLLSIVLSIASINTMWGTARTFKSGEKIYFKDASGNITWGDLNCLWKVASGDIFAYFWNDTENGWSTSASVKYGTVNQANTIYEITVPGSGKEFTKVLFTRHPNGVTPSFSNRWNQTEDQTPDVGYNLFCIANDGSYDSKRDPTHKWKGNWSRYAHDGALIGEFNNWNPDTYPLSNSGVKGVLVTLPASTTYKFKILLGETYYGLDGNKKITSTLTSWWTFYSGQGDVYIQTDVAGDYGFAWNASSKNVTVYYPDALYPKSTYIYLDVSRETYWKANPFTARFYLKYFDSGTDLAGMPLECSKPVEDYVYYVQVPDNGYIGHVQLNRYYNSAVDGISSVANVYDRGSATKNCLIEESGKESATSDWMPAWTTYCPPTTSETFSDNSTSKISWQPNTNDGSTSGKAILVKTGTTLMVSASASKAVPDGNMTVKYDFNVNSGATTTNTTGTYNSTASTNNTQYAVNVKMYTNYNLDNTASSTKHTHTIYYKALNTYSVTHNATFVSKTDGRNGTDAAAYHMPYSATYSATEGYNLPATITVKFGETTKEAGTDYTWNQATGELSIPEDKIDGNVTITITGVEKTYDISYAAGTYGSGTLTGGTKFHFTDYTLSDNNTAFTRDNYVYDGWSTNADGSSKDYELGGSYETNAAQIFYPHWVPAYTVEHSLTLASSVSGATGAKAAVHGVAYTATFRATVGYNLPSDIEVTVASDAQTKNTHYSWSVSEGLGTLTVFAASVTGNIVVTITGEPATLSFTGTGTQWNNTGSWTPACIPTINHDVVIATNTCWIGENVQAKAKSVRIDSYNGGANIRIEAGGGLIIAEDIKAKHSADGSYEATNDQDLWIKTSTLYNGGLVCGNECPGTNAEYVFQSRIYRYGSFYINQYVGIPFTGMDPFQWYGVYVFEYDPENDNWKTPEDQYADLKPFTAYDIISKTSGVTYTDFYTHGELNLPGTSGTQKLTCGSRIDDTFGEDGDYMFANSWVAPIDVASIDDTEAASKDGEGDYWGILGEVHYFNAGYVNPTADAKKEIGDLAGQWSVLPFSSSSYMDNAVIPACQAFCVTATNEGGWLKLNYGKHVYTPAANAGQINTTPTYAPRRVKAEDVAPIKLRVKVSSGSDIADQIYIFEREDFTEGYDNSWDGAKLFGNATAPQLYTEKGDFKLSVDATPEMDGTLIGFKAGTNDYEYTFSFEYDDDEPLYLYDKETQDFTRISNEATYTFQTKDNAEHSRFALTRSNAPQIVTAFENTEYEAENRAEKFIKNNMLFIRRGDKVYSIDGTQVK